MTFALKLSNKNIQPGNTLVFYNNSSKIRSGVHYKVENVFSDKIILRNGLVLYILNRENIDLVLKSIIKTRF